MTGNDEATERFRIQRELGAGGMGVVYEALDCERNCRVALKVLRRLDAEGILRFKNEFRALQDVQHRNLVTLGELIEEAGRWFFTMELVDGVDFLRYVRRSDPAQSASLATPSDFDPSTIDLDPVSRIPRPSPAAPATRLDEQRLRAALAQLAEGLIALHAAGKIHRDIKPSNVMVTSEGRVVILDFGVLTEAARLPDRKQVIGTAAYMAPEQAAASHIGPEADWYAVGTMLYLALTGQLPFAGDPRAMIELKQHREPTPPRHLFAHVPPDLDRLCTELLRVQPMLRPQGTEVLQRLRVQAGDAPDVAQPGLFIGRQRELAALGEAFEATRSGRAVTVYIHGESGIGKSSLVRQFTEDLVRTHPAVVFLAGRCYERESVPFKAVDGIIDELSRFMARLPNQDAAALLPGRAALLAQTFPVLRQIEAIAQLPTPSGGAVDPHELRARVFAALRELLVRLAQRHPLVLAIDDLQWADADSLGLLTELMRPPGEPALLLLANVRTTATEWARPTMIAGEVRSLPLAALPPDDAHRLASALLGQSQETALAMAIATEAAGHPLFIDALVRQGRATEGGRLRLDDAIWSRVGRLEASARHLLELVTVAGGPLRQDIAAAAVAADPNELGRVLAQLRVANLVRTSGSRYTDRIEPYHDRVRAAVAAHLEPKARAACHRRLATALEAGGGADLETLSIHWRECGDRQRAATYATFAAKQAADALAFDRAARLYGLALELGQFDRDERRVLLIRLGEALVNAGRGAEGAQAFEEASVAAGAAEALDLRRRVAEQLLRCGRVDEGLEALRGVLNAIGLKFPRTPRGALASLLWHQLRLRLRGLRFKQRPATEIPLESLQRIDTCWGVATAMANTSPILGAGFQTQSLLLALRAGEPIRIARAVATEAGYLSVTGPRGRKRARRLIEVAQALAEKHDHPEAWGYLEMSYAIVVLHAGEWEKGRRHLERAEAIFRERCTGKAWERWTLRLWLCSALQHLGELREMSRLHAELLTEADALRDHYAQANLRIYRQSTVWLMADDVEGARREAQRAAELWPPQRSHLQHCFHVFSLAQIDLYEGNATSAHQRIERAWSTWQRGMVLRTQVLRILALQVRSNVALARAAVVGEPEALLGAAERAAGRIERERAHWALPLARLTRAGIAAARGDSATVVELLRAAISEFDAADMRLLREVARRRLGQSLGTDEGMAAVATADDWMTRAGIRKPARLCAMLAPGF